MVDIQNKNSDFANAITAKQTVMVSLEIALSDFFTATETEVQHVFEVKFKEDRHISDLKDVALEYLKLIRRGWVNYRGPYWRDLRGFPASVTLGPSTPLSCSKIDTPLHMFPSPTCSLCGPATSFHFCVHIICCVLKVTRGLKSGTRGVFERLSKTKK